MTARIGFGTDLHRLRPGDGIWLGGIKVPADRSADAHSDGDVALHALTDAVLGAAGLGDIGECFPADKVAEGEASGRFVLEAVRLAAARGFRVVNADLTIDLERPKLSMWKRAIRDSVAGLLAVDPERVNVKAKTAEGVGPVGEGVAVSAQAAVLMEVALH